MNISVGLVIATMFILIVGTTNVYARESNSKRYSDGYNDGFNWYADHPNDGPNNCDPTLAHTSDGTHTTIYCNGWAAGYTAASNGNSGPPTQQLCSDGSQPDSNGNCPNPQQPSQNQPDLISSLCHAVNSRSGLITAAQTLAPLLHLATGGLSTIVPLVQAYCAVHGG